MLDRLTHALLALRLSASRRSYEEEVDKEDDDQKRSQFDHPCRGSRACRLLGKRHERFSETDVDDDSSWAGTRHVVFSDRPPTC